MSEYTSTQILSAIADTVNRLTGEEPQPEIEYKGPQPLHMPPIPGTTVHAQALKQWLNNACKNVPGSTLTTESLGLMSRVGQCIADPDNMRVFVAKAYNVLLIVGPDLHEKQFARLFQTSVQEGFQANDVYRSRDVQPQLVKQSLQPKPLGELV